VHGKRSLIDKIHGDPWQKHASLRLLSASWRCGQKLLFMG
jgi:1,4-alpha-glucan branching enzyme